MATNKQRREAERRRMQRQAQRRRQRAQSRKRNNLILSVVGALVVVGVVIGLIVSTNGDDPKPAAKASSAASSKAASSKAPSTSASSKAAPGRCSFPVTGSPARPVTPPAASAATKGIVEISVATSRGPMTFALDRSKAPCDVASFVSLVKQKFFDQTPCPRVESTNLFILQCGDPTGTGMGGPGYTVPDEYIGNEKYTAGTLAMANTGAPNSGGSQFFIVYKADKLPPSYTIFGRVTKGLDVVTKVAAGGNDGSNQAGGGKPKLAINLTTLKVIA